MYNIVDESECAQHGQILVQIQQQIRQQIRHYPYPHTHMHTIIPCTWAVITINWGLLTLAHIIAQMF